MVNKQTFYIIFRRCDSKLPWWQRMFVPDKRMDEFSHCGVMMQFGCDVLQVDSDHQGVWFNKMFDKEVAGGFIDAELLAQAYEREKGYKVLRYVASSRGVFHCGNLPPTCVTMVKSIIGRSSWEITPYQLYKGLIKDGAVEIHG